MESYHSIFCNIYAKIYIAKCLRSKGEVCTKQLISYKGSKEGNEVSKDKKGVYIKKHGKLQIIPWGACFRLVRFFSLKNLPVNLSVSLKVVRAQYRGKGHLTFLHEKNTLL